MTREMKDSGIEWIGEIPKDWAVVRTKRKYTNQKEIVGERENEYERLALTLNGVVKRSKDDGKGLQPEKFETYQILYEDELIFKLIDLENVKTSRVGYSQYTGLVSPVYVRLINPKESRYGYYFFINMWYQEVFNYLGSGVRSNLTASDLLNVPYLDVPCTEQKKIVQSLDEKTRNIDSLIKKTHQSIEELKKYKLSIITETVIKGLDLNVEMKNSEIDWLRKIPMHWNEIKIKYVLSEKNEKSVTGEEEPLSMSQKYGIIPSKHMDRIPNPSASNVGNRIVEKNDLVFNKLKAHLGVFDVSKYEGIVSPDYAVYQINSQSNINIEYLNYLFKTPLMIAEFIKNSRGVGAGLTRLYTSEFFNIKIPIPGINEQNQIVLYLDNEINKIDNLIQDKEKVMEEFQNYKKSLIYEYVTGKKEV